MERAASDVKIASEFVLDGHGTIGPNLNVGQILPGVPETVNPLGVIVVGIIHAESEWPSGHGPIDILMKISPSGFKHIANTGPNNHVTFGPGHSGHPFDHLGVGPRVKHEFHRSVSGKPSVHGLNAGLHSTDGAVKKIVVDGRHTIGGETRVSSFPELNSGVIRGEPVAHLSASYVEVASDDETKARIFKSDQKIL